MSINYIISINIKNEGYIMFNKRLKTYKSLKYTVIEPDSLGI